MKGKLELQKYRIILIIFALCTLLFSVGVITYAAYTHSLNAQRTIAPYDSVESDKFSSNYLLKVTYSRENVKTILTTDALISASTSITVCNYAQGKQTQPNNNVVNYSVSATLVYYDESAEDYLPVDASYLTSKGYSGYSISLRKKNGSTVTLNSSHLADTSLSGTLAANEAHSDTFILTFSTDFASNPNLFIEILATDSGSATSLKGIFGADVRSQGVTNSWSGSFTDDNANDPSDYDGFNYAISGFGSGVFTLSWNTNYVDISAASLIDLMEITGFTKTGPTDGIVTISFDVDSDDISRYEIQFYKVNITTESWSDMEDIVTHNFS